jgi:hypothetical protein
MVLAREAENTPASLSGLGLGFSSEIAPRTNYNASRKYANLFCHESFPGVSRASGQFFGA